MGDHFSVTSLQRNASAPLIRGFFRNIHHVYFYEEFGSGFPRGWTEGVSFSWLQSSLFLRIFVAWILDYSPGREKEKNGLGLLSWDRTVGNSKVVEHLLGISDDSSVTCFKCWIKIIGGRLGIYISNMKYVHNK